MISRTKKRIQILVTSFLALFVTSWLELALQKKQHLIGAGINRVFLFLLINLHVVIIVALLYLIIRQSIKLFVEIHRENPGSNFKRNLLFAFTFFSVVPSFFVFFVAGKLITTNIDNWFSARIKVGLEQSLTLHQEQTKNLRDQIKKDGQLFFEKIKSLNLIENIKNNQEIVDTQILKLLNQTENLKNYSFYIWHDDGKELLGSIKDEISIWRNFRRLNDRTTNNLKKKFFEILSKNNNKKEFEFDFYGSLYFVKEIDIFHENFDIKDLNFHKTIYLILIYRYPENIRYPLISIENSIDDYEQLKSMKNPIFRSYLLTFILVTLLILFLSIWCAFYLARGISKPIQDLLGATEKIRSGDWNIKVHYDPDSDLKNLGLAFNEMTKAIRQAHYKLEEQNKEMLKLSQIKTWQKAAKQIAHEIKNPLTPIQLATQRLQRKYSNLTGVQEKDKQIFQDCTNTILDHVQIIKDLVTHFAEFAQMPSNNIEILDLNEIIREELNLYKTSYPDIDFVVELYQDLPEINFDKNKLTRVIVNLLDNSIRAILKEADIKKKHEIRLQTNFKKEENCIRFLFSDNGPGIPAQVKNKLFLPYVSTEKKNMGLGLSIIHEIVIQSGGSIKLLPSIIGTVFEISLPIK